VGRQLVFSGYLRDANADTNITATGAVYQGRMTVTSNAQATPVGGTSSLILDSSRVPTGVSEPPFIWIVRPFFVKREPPTGTAKFEFLTSIGLFYRTFGIARTDSLQWVTLVRQDTGLTNEWIAFDGTYTGAIGQVRLVVAASIEGREELSLGGQAFNAYRIRAVRRIYLGGATTPSVTGTTATIWLQPNVGIVKFIFNSDGETPGFYREFQSKNF
ncbi:MAG: hypothetical protein WD295_01660, partial [Bacteroidota bacterium]